MRATHALTLVLLVTVTLSGCAGIGKQDFACPGYPSKPLCMSTSEVYRLTDGDALPQAVVKRPPIDDAGQCQGARVRPRSARELTAPRGRMGKAGQTEFPVKRAKLFIPTRTERP
jgi:hypothetical protein